MVQAPTVALVCEKVMEMWSLQHLRHLALNPTGAHLAAHSCGPELHYCRRGTAVASLNMALY